MSTEPIPIPPTAKRNPDSARAFGIIAVVAGLFFGGRYYIWSQTHVSTDDAYVTGNIVQVSPTVAGTLSQLMVAEGDAVSAGQVVAILDDTAQKAALQSAESALLVAKGNVRQAEAQLTLQRASDTAAMAKAQAAKSVSMTKVKAAEAGVRATSDDAATRIATLKASVAASEAATAQAVAALSGGQSQAAAAKAVAVTAAAAVQSASANLAAVKARIPSLEAELQRAERDFGRYTQLYTKQAVTKQQLEGMANAVTRERSALDAGTEQVRLAAAQLKSAESQAVEARERAAAAAAQVKFLDAAVRTAQSSTEVTRGQLSTAVAGQRHVDVDIVGVQTARAAADVSDAEAQIVEAGMGQQAVRYVALETAKDAVRTAEAGVVTAKEMLKRTILVAAQSGVVLKKTANVGASIVPGQTILTISQGDALWVTANFKETQVRDMHPGQPVDIHVDALPNAKVEGVIAGIGTATGATTAMLPPDNASGNFTKVVQRIPVRIAITKAVPGIRMGMSTTTTIDTADKTDHAERIPAGWNGKPTSSGKQ
ncbi:MAG: HlyD family secretion protein [Armatimonadota bacterium]